MKSFLFCKFRNWVVLISLMSVLENWGSLISACAFNLLEIGLSIWWMLELTEMYSWKGRCTSIVLEDKSMAIWNLMLYPNSKILYQNFKKNCFLKITYSTASETVSVNFLYSAVFKSVTHATLGNIIYCLLGKYLFTELCLFSKLNLLPFIQLDSFTIAKKFNCLISQLAVSDNLHSC